MSPTYLIWEGVYGDIFRKLLFSKENDSLYGRHVLCEFWTNNPQHTNIPKVASISYHTINSCKIETCEIHVSKLNL